MVNQTSEVFKTSEVFGLTDRSAHELMQVAREMMKGK